MKAVLGACAAVLMFAGSASAQLYGVNSLDTAGNYWYADYFGRSNLTVTNNGMAGIRYEDRNFTGSGFANRHHAALAVNGSAYLFQPNQSFKFEVDITVNGPGRTEAGIWHGTAPFWGNSASADTGNLMFRPGDTVASDEIAAFGGRLPFFSNNQPENSGMARAQRGVTTHLTVEYCADVSPRLYRYGVNNVFTSWKVEGVDTAGFQPNSYLGVYVQGPNWFGTGDAYPRGDVDVQFSNLSLTVPAPASFALLGLGSLVAGRRRR